jgi:hypothetical protein
MFLFKKGLNWQLLENQIMFKKLFDWILGRNYEADPTVKYKNGIFCVKAGRSKIFLSREQARNLWGELGSRIRRNPK